MARLLQPDEVAELSRYPLESHYLLVAEHADTRQLLAVAMIRVEQPRAYLRALAVRPTCEDTDLGEQMIVAAAALSIACGCEMIEVPSTHAAAVRGMDLLN